VCFNDSIIVQSEKSPVYIEERIELFLQQLLNIVESMIAEQYQKHLVAISSKLTEKFKNLNQGIIMLILETRRMWGAIQGMRYDFDQCNNDAILVKSISLADFLKFYQEKIIGPNRRKMSVHLISQKLPKTYNIQGYELNQDSVTSFKKLAELHKCNEVAKPISEFLL
jgi:insulysin